MIFRRRRRQEPDPQVVAVARFRYVMRTAGDELLGKILGQALARLTEAERVEWVEALAQHHLVLRIASADAESLNREVLSRVSERGAEGRSCLADSHTAALVASVRRSDAVSQAYEGFMSSPEAAEAGVPDVGEGVAQGPVPQPPAFLGTHAGGRR